ncbi:FAD:protein FMN transferase [Nitrosomonas sp. Nm33]|uniref:FAD:protein FMN transferase n=1 Tax=Nitrosomonas sp. Nm33 TaxID=133724 RepID=UPI0008975866|nr:FAD:protein FMN transferase [Nitrosomonas sp. Nm33]SDY03944.1 thiamine biosynthesis lipoprotein [Nitrosomonas sp. Nm33]
MKLYRFPFKAMGTPCEIQVYAVTETKARRATDAAIADIQRLESVYSRYRESSFLSEINQIAAKGGSITVDNETAGLLDYAETCYRESDELFDITSGILRRAWDFKSNQLPDETVIQTLLDKIGWHKLRWSSPVLEFPLAGMEIDMGGVVKEYAVDRAATICWDRDIQHGIVNLGGDIKIIGPHADGSPWRIGIRHPRHPDTLLQTLELYSGALASSGDYERCITINGTRYGHVLNPKTGWPVSWMAAVSVVGDFCVIAGSASTIGMLKDQQGKDWLADLGLPHLWVDIDGRIGGSLTEENKHIT